MEEVLCRTSLMPLAPPCCVLCLVGVETEGFLNCQGRVGIHHHCAVEPLPSARTPVYARRATRRFEGALADEGIVGFQPGAALATRVKTHDHHSALLLGERDTQRKCL